MTQRRWLLATALMLLPLWAAAQWRESTPQEEALDQSAFEGMAQTIDTRFPNVQSVVVALRGRKVFAYDRDGAPDALRDVRSVAKSAVSTLVGIALAQGHIASLDDPVLKLVPEWAPLNADPRSQQITLRHLLTMSAGFQFNDPTGTAPGRSAKMAWARPLAHDPGQHFAYDNATQALLIAALEKATGKPVADYAREQLVKPLGMKEPSYQRGLHMRTEDMAKLGQLLLQNGAWAGQQLLPAAYAAQATTAQNTGGPPVGLAYGHLWWVVPSKTPRPTFMASGYSGQFIWVQPAMQLVIATTSTVSADAQKHGQALQLIRGRLFEAAQVRALASAVKSE